MSDVTKPDLEEVYRLHNLRTKHSRNKTTGEAVSWLDAFPDIAAIKKEIRSVIMKPLLAAIEVAKQLGQAILQFVIGGFQILTFDWNGFSTLGNAFLHIGNAVLLGFEGAYHSVGALVSLFTRTASTCFHIVAMIFTNETIDPVFVEGSDYAAIEAAPVSDAVYAAPVVAPEAAPIVPATLYPAIDECDAQPIPLSKCRETMFQTKPRLSYLQERARIETIFGLSDDARLKLAEALEAKVNNGEVDDDRDYGVHSTPPTMQ